MFHSRRSALCALGLAFAVFFGLAPFCPGIPPEEVDSEDAAIRMGKHDIEDTSTITVDITANRRSTNAFLFQGTTYRLTPPYTVDCTAGLPTPAHATGFTPGFGGLELSSPGSSPLVFHGLYVQPAPTGTQAFFAYNNGAGTTSGGATFFSGASFLDLRIENNGSNVMFHARPMGSGMFTSLGTVPAPVVPYLGPGIGVFNFGDGRTLSFFDIFISEESEPQGSSYEYVADKFQQRILFPLNNAFNHLNGPEPNVDAAEALVDGLAANIPGLLVELNTLPSGTPDQQKLLADLEKAIVKVHKEVLKAQKAMGKGKDARKSLAKARLQMDQIIGILRGQ